jgi:hypothetical protein
MGLRDVFEDFVDELSLFHKWDDFFLGKLILTKGSGVQLEYAYFFNDKIYLGKYEIHENPEWVEGTEQKIMSMLLDPEIIIKEIKGTEEMIENVLCWRKDGFLLQGLDGIYDFKKKNKAVWESAFTGEREKCRDFRLGEMMHSYFSKLNGWEFIKTEE